MGKLPAAFGRLGPENVQQTIGAIVVIFLVGFFARLVQVRTRFRKAMRQYNVPMIPHSFLLGHIVPLAKVVSAYPRDFSKLGMPFIVAKAYPEIAACGVIYIDTWPLGGTLMCVYHPDMIAQFTQDKSWLKHPMVLRELGPMTHGNDLPTMEGAKWKRWRAAFNPGFSAKNLTELLPAFLEEIEVLKSILMDAAASGKILKIEEVAKKTTVDIIFRAAMGIRLHYQTEDVPFVHILTNQISWLVVDWTIPSLLKVMNPYRYLKLWFNNYRMEKFLTPFIEGGISEFAHGNGAPSGPKTINYLAVKAYMAEKSPTDSPTSSVIDREFMEIAVAQLKIFIFAGHDTTASTVSFAFSRVYKNPTILARLRAEHDTVLGPDPKEAFAKVTANPNLLNQLPYTAAVVKEALRIYPPAATVRLGGPDLFVVNPVTGMRFPTTNVLVLGSSYGSHRLPAYWERPDEFLPERWLAPEGDPLHPRKNAWRPFEHGPRNCIGQELALLEMRAILAMTVRELDIEEAYPANAPEAFGEKAYQSMSESEITGHVKDGFPARIRLREK